MCGFAAIVRIGGRAAEPETLRRMTDSIVHRGPDDLGYHVEGPVGLGFRRLSILDLSPTGHQPMVAADGSSVIVFNGEIFNFVELRAELAALGHQFRSTGDTEVILAAYRQWGTDCLRRFNGMWAFLLYDRKRRIVFGARDRFGVKPLYLLRRSDGLYFGSEIKAILAAGEGGAEPHWPLVSEFLLRQRLEDPSDPSRTFFRDVEQIRPGQAFELSLDGTWKSWAFWTLDGVEERTEGDVPGAYADLFEDAVRLRLRSDVPIGVCLSGGMDSTAIICAMARQRAAAGVPAEDRLQAFCYTPPEFDESRYVNDTLAQTGAELNRMRIDPAGLWSTLERFLWHQDEPVHSTSALIGYELMRLARSKDVKVVLNGQGADETLAGYPDYFRQRWYTLLVAGRVAEAWREIRAYATAHGRSAGRLFRTAAAHAARHQLRRVAAYRGLASRRQSRADRASPWFTEALTRHAAARVPPFVDFRLRPGLRSSLEGHPLPLFLRVEDRNSMAHSVEARLPFMDYRLVKFAFELPDRWKIRGGWNKYALREAMRGRIPESVRTRVDKMGFPTQHREWFAGPWYEPMQDLLASRSTRERGIWRVEALRQGLERHRRREVDLSEPLLFNVAQVELWLRNLVDAAAQPAPAAGRRPA